jgi:hypothetical protein
MKLTKETIQMTRQWYADNAAACIEEVKNGTVKVNDTEKYYKWREQSAVDFMAGKYDHSFGFIQRAVVIQTGECYALLP